MALWRGAHGGTLSEHTRRALGVHPARPWKRAAVASLVAVCVWFPWHIAVYEDSHHG